MGYSIRGSLLVGSYIYITCISDEEDTIGDIRVYSTDGKFVIEECTEASAIKGDGVWEESSPTEVDPLFTAWENLNNSSDYILPSWLGNNLITSPASILYSNVDDYITYVLSQGGTIQDIQTLTSLIGSSGNTDVQVGININGVLRVGNIPNSLGNILTEIGGKLHHVTLEELSNELNIPELVQTDWNEADTESPAFLLNKPTIPSQITSEGDLGNINVADGSGGWNASDIMIDGEALHHAGSTETFIRLDQDEIVLISQGNIQAVDEENYPYEASAASDLITKHYLENIYDPGSGTETDPIFVAWRDDDTRLANKVFATDPAITGSASFRSLELDDLPDLSAILPYSQGNANIVNVANGTGFWLTTNLKVIGDKISHEADDDIYIQIGEDNTTIRAGGIGGHILLQYKNGNGYSPTTDYAAATKKYVDDLVSANIVGSEGAVNNINTSDGNGGWLDTDLNLISDRISNKFDSDGYIQISDDYLDIKGVSAVFITSNSVSAKKLLIEADVLLYGANTSDPYKTTHQSGIITLAKLEDYVSTIPIDHNDLNNIDGGTSATEPHQYYHLSLAQHTIATQPAGHSESGYVTDGAQDFGGVKTFMVFPIKQSMTQGDLTPTANNQFATKYYVDSKVTTDNPSFGAQYTVNVSDGDGEWLASGILIEGDEIKSEADSDIKLILSESESAIINDIIRARNLDDEPFMASSLADIVTKKYLDAALDGIGGTPLTNPMSNPHDMIRGKDAGAPEVLPRVTSAGTYILIQSLISGTYTTGWESTIGVNQLYLSKQNVLVGRAVAGGGTAQEIGIDGTTLEIDNNVLKVIGGGGGGDGIQSLNGLEASSQTFAVNSTSSSLAWTSSGSTHTLGIPLATASRVGLISLGTQVFAGQKEIELKLKDHVVGNSKNIIGIGAIVPNNNLNRNLGSGTNAWGDTYANKFLANAELRIGYGTASNKWSFTISGSGDLDIKWNGNLRFTLQKDGDMKFFKS